jgi:hypothetical protein
MLQPRRWLSLAWLVALILLTFMAHSAEPVRIMILDGESAGPYHDWRAVTQVLRKQLLDTGRFAVDVVTAPPAGADFGAFQPDFARYQAVVFNYDAPDERWPAALKHSFESYMTEGGGLVIVANFQRDDWPRRLAQS